MSTFSQWIVLWAPGNSFDVCFCSGPILPLQERTGVQMIMIQDDPMPTGADKPLRITGDPHKVQVGLKRAHCVPLPFQFTLDFTHFMPPVSHSNIRKHLCSYWESLSWSLSFYDSHVVSFVKIVFWFKKKKLCILFIYFAASPWTCGEAHPRQGPGRVQGWQSGLWIQNGRKQSGCKSFPPHF